MKTKFSNRWKSSSKPSKQIKYKANAPLHTKRKFLSVRLSKELTEKYKTRNITVRSGDKVKVVRGRYKNHIGKVERVSPKKERIFIDGTERTKTDNTKSLYPIHPSNVIIQELKLDDKKRKESLERKAKK